MMVTRASLAPLSIRESLRYFRLRLSLLHRNSISSAVKTRMPTSTLAGTIWVSPNQNPSLAMENRESMVESDAPQTFRNRMIRTAQSRTTDSRRSQIRPGTGSFSPTERKPLNRTCQGCLP